MICECDAPVPSHFRMSHTVIRKPRMHGSPERNPGVIEILESKVFTVSSPSLPALSHERSTVTRVFIPAGEPGFVLKTYNQQLKTLLDVQRLQLRIHQERIIKLRHLAPAFAKNREQSRGKRFVPLERQAGHVSNNQRKLIRSDVAGQRNRVQSRAAHRRITQKRIN